MASIKTTRATPTSYIGGNKNLDKINTSYVADYSPLKFPGTTMASTLISPNIAKRGISSLAG